MVHAVLSNTDGWFDSMVQLGLVRERVDVMTFVEIAAVSIPSRFLKDVS